MIYLLDTNLLSEAMRDEPHSSVVAWLRDCPADAMFTTAISRAEIFYGIRRLAEGGKRRRLERAAQAMFGQEFRGRVLPSTPRRPTSTRNSGSCGPKAAGRSPPRTP